MENKGGKAKLQMVKGTVPCIPVTDVGVTYGNLEEASTTITFVGYMNKPEILRYLRLMSKHRTPYEYKDHSWRNAAVEVDQNKLTQL